MQLHSLVPTSLPIHMFPPPPGSSKGGEHANHQRETDPGDQTHPACAGARKLGAQQLRLSILDGIGGGELVKRERDKKRSLTDCTLPSFIGSIIDSI